MEDSIRFDYQMIEAFTKHKDKSLEVLGWVKADDVKYKIQQNKIQVFPGGNEESNRQNVLEDDLIMKNVRHRNDGRWEFRRTIKGQKFECINKNREVVRQFALDVKDKIKAIEKNGVDNSRITFYDYAVNYYNLCKRKLSDSTKAEYATAHKVFKRYFNRTFRNLTADDFQRFLNRLEDKHPTTAVKMYHKIRAVCRRAFVEGVIKYNIGEILVSPDAQNNTRRALTLEEQRAFLEKIKERPKDFQVFCLFCIVTSARRNEAARLQPEHLNEVRQTLFINGTKTLNAPRTIKVTPQFIELLKSNNVKFLHKGDYYAKIAKKIFREMKCEDLTLNCLRHTCATNMVYLGISSDYRKHIMGHSTTLTTDRVYTHIDPTVTKKDIENLYPGLYYTDF